MQIAIFKLPSLVVLGALAALLFAGSSVAKKSSSSYRVSLVKCHQSKTEEERFARYLVKASVGKLKNVDRLAVRLTLEELAEVEDEDGDLVSKYQPVEAEGLGEWTESESGVKSLKVKQKFENLAAPGIYRLKAQFRWLDEDGEVLREKTKRSKRCKLKADQADLKAVQLDILPFDDDPELAKYQLIFKNSGKVHAEDFEVALEVGGVEQNSIEIGQLQIGESAKATLPGAVCQPGDSITVTVDPENQVSEESERNNSLTFDCPEGGYDTGLRASLIDLK